MANFNRGKTSVTNHGPSNWQRSLRRSDVTDYIAGPVTSSYVRPKSERQSTEIWPAPTVEGTKAGRQGRKAFKEAKLSLVDEEDIVLEDVFEDLKINKHVPGGEAQAAAAARRPRRSRKSTIGSIGDAREDPENVGAIVKKGPRRSRRSTLGSIGSLQEQEVFQMDDLQSVGPKGGGEMKKKASRAPKKSKKGLTLPVPSHVGEGCGGGGGGLLSPNNLSSLNLSGLSLTTTSVPPVSSPLPLPPGVVCIDLEDGAEETYFSDIINYKKVEEATYAAHFNFTDWKLRNYSVRRSDQTRAILMDWIIEVVHYFKAGQETLYNAVHLIDRYVSARRDEVDHRDIQLVGTAAVLLATKLEEYYPADIRMLAKLTQNSVTEDDIRQMELDIMSTLDFNTYCLDPMIFLNRFIRAALRMEDRPFIEACCLFLDATITNATYWAIPTSKKCAAAVLAALCLVPGTEWGEVGQVTIRLVGKDPLWTPTLHYYTGYTHSQLSLMARQMLALLENTLQIPAESDCGLRVKYRSVSRHCAFLSSAHCRLHNIEAAARGLNYHE